MAEYFRRGVSTVRWLTAAPSTPPTAAQIAAGANITPFVADLTGWEFENSPITTPKLSTTFTTTIPGEDTSPNPAITFYDDDGTPSPNARTLLAKGNAGWMVLCPIGETAAKKANVFPVTSTGVNDQWTTGNEAAQFGVTFAVTAAPILNQTIA